MRNAVEGCGQPQDATGTQGTVPPSVDAWGTKRQSAHSVSRARGGSCNSTTVVFPRMQGSYCYD